MSRLSRSLKSRQLCSVVVPDGCWEKIALVDFKKRQAEKPTDPIKLYDTLDRAHDKGPLRPAQLAVLKAWFDKHKNTRDVIVKPCLSGCYPHPQHVGCCQAPE